MPSQPLKGKLNRGHITVLIARKGIKNTLTTAFLSAYGLVRSKLMFENFTKDGCKRHILCKSVADLTETARCKMSLTP